MFVSLGGRITHVRIDGPVAATPLVLLHSLGTSAEVWDAQARALAGPFRVYRPDFRGHGLSADATAPYEIADLAGDVLAVMDALHVDAAHVAGMSVGGMVAQALAHLAPARVLSLVLVDTAMVIPPAQAWLDRAALVRAHGMGAIADAVMARWVTPVFAADPSAQGLRTMLLRTPAEGYAQLAEAIGRADLTEQTGALTVSTTVIVGELDEATPVASARALATALRGALSILPDAAHIPTIEVPDAVTAAMRAHLIPPVINLFESGLAMRRRVLGAAHVERSMAQATAMDIDFQHFATEMAWGTVWTRPGLTLRERSMLVIALLAGLGHHEELRLHLNATRNTGATPADVTEVLLHVAAYAGIPAANSAVRLAKEILGAGEILAEGVAGK